MRIDKGSAIPIQLHSSGRSSEKVSNKNQEGKPTEEERNDTLHISMEGLKKFEDEKETARDKLPSHIKSMIEAIEKLIDMIEQAEESLLKAKEASYPDDETRQTVLEQHQNNLNSLEMSRFDAIRNLQDAMKEAGISEPGIIADLMR